VSSCSSASKRASKDAFPVERWVFHLVSTHHRLLIIFFQISEKSPLVRNDASLNTSGVKIRVKILDFLPTPVKIGEVGEIFFHCRSYPADLAHEVRLSKKHSARTKYNTVRRHRSTRLFVKRGHRPIGTTSRTKRRHLESSVCSQRTIRSSEIRRQEAGRTDPHTLAKRQELRSITYGTLWW